MSCQTPALVPTTPCRSCIHLDSDSIPCFPGVVGEADVFSLYSLDEPPFTFVPNCPPGVDCSNGPPFLNLTCCDQQIFVDLTGVSGQEKTDKINKALTKCALLMQACGLIPNPPTTPGTGGPQIPPPIIIPPTFWNTPQPCRVSCPDGSEFEVVVPAAMTFGFSQAQADALASAYACTVAGQLKICLPSIQPSVCLGTAYSSNILPTGPGPYAFSLQSGALPTGLTLTTVSTAMARISGTPTVAGTYTFTIRALNTVSGLMHDRSYTIGVVGISNIGAIPDAQLGVVYPTFTFAAAGGTAPYKFDILVSGTEGFPNGLQIDPNTGEFFGTPSNAQLGVYNFRIRLTAAAGHDCTFPASITLKNAGCVDWDSVSWVGISAQPARGISSFTAAGGSLTFSANDPGVGPGGTPDVQDGTATFSFSAAADCLCRVTFNATSFNNPVLGGSNLNGGFTILQDGNLVLEVVINHGPGNPFNDGYFDSNIDGNIPHDLVLAASPIIVQFKLLASPGSTIVIRGKGIVPSYIWLNASGNGENVFCDYSATFEVVP